MRELIASPSARRTPHDLLPEEGSDRLGARLRRDEGESLAQRPSKLNRRLAERLHEGGSETRPYTNEFSRVGADLRSALVQLDRIVLYVYSHILLRLPRT